MTNTSRYAQIRGESEKETNSMIRGPENGLLKFLNLSFQMKLALTGNCACRYIVHIGRFFAGDLEENGKALFGWTRS